MENGIGSRDFSFFFFFVSFYIFISGFWRGLYTESMASTSVPGS